MQKRPDARSVCLATSVAYAISREENNSKLLEGLGDTDAGATINVFGEYRGENYSFDAKFINQISGDDTGFLVDLDAGYTASFADKLALKYGVIASYASSEYMEQYFGVSAVQSRYSGLCGFD